ncbi:bacterio-opsin activator HTH domain-containing protein [Natrialba chahannaoensis JCM 10990]|uniref:Bacterio-opsin activator HTH domain-containing protein n=1 Tax=Natrialba chahannaoensis JCM 10990 TaxID=1227492 RepID=M0B0C8_9EURY|nr:helix-turn-helix domain-containing protein [Natrialba chahannaoensis]ELZ03139.1 bacterio-opsin activator HTH domain-containing protein [Natrialba chahannaoensis JCM 10990]
MLLFIKKLAARQLKAIAIARELGYYEVPQTGSLANVATALECSESAASTLLRTAESKLVDAAVQR